MEKFIRKSVTLQSVSTHTGPYRIQRVTLRVFDISGTQLLLFNRHTFIHKDIQLYIYLIYDATSRYLFICLGKHFIKILIDI